MSTNKQGSLVYLVDDDFAIRDSLSLFIESAGQAVKSFESAEQFLQAYDQEQPGCLLLDVRMPVMSGLDLQDVLLKNNIDIPIIFISGHAVVSDSVKAFRAGAVDFIEKPFDNQVLLERIQEALYKDIDTRTENAKKLKLMHAIDQLTLREKEILYLIVNNYSSKKVASVLGISSRTVEVHRAHIIEKTHTESITELLLMIVRYDFVTHLTIIRQPTSNIGH
ncbi:MAG: DNA-binding response regulator [Methylobacter sp.]|nr:MAG: DNA-binding response regulator [Methylobacter sp.]